jgi:hypothetical protein
LVSPPTNIQEHSSPTSNNIGVQHRDFFICQMGWETLNVRNLRSDKFASIPPSLFWPFWCVVGTLGPKWN